RDPSGHYLDMAARSGIGTASQLYLGFGVLFFDYDLDGRMDIFVANGHIQDDADMRQTGVLYKEPSLLLRNTGAGGDQDVTAQAGAAVMEKTVGRGAAWGDFDNDGRPDLLLTTNNGPARLLHNEGTGTSGAEHRLRDGGEQGTDSRLPNHWLRLRLEGTQSN